MNVVRQNKHYKWFNFVSLLFALIETVDSESCTVDSDCYSTNKIPCATCASEVSDQALHCVYLYPEIYEEVKECTFITTCKDNCNNRGKCVQSQDNSFVPYCECNDTFYGVSCNEESKGPLISKYSLSVKVTTTKPLAFSNAYFAEKYTILYKAMDGTDPTNYIVTTLSTEEGYLHIIYLKLVGANYLESLKKYSYTHGYTMRFSFISRERENQDKFLTNDDIIIGYRSKVIVSVYVYGKELYTRNFSTLVLYKENLKCVPAIKLSNCAKYGWAPSPILRSQRLQVRSSVTYLEDGKRISTSKTKQSCSESATYQWGIYILNSTSPKLYRGSHYGMGPFVSDPYTLDFGLHRLTLNIKVIQPGENSTNHAGCYVQVKSVPLVALIDGGNDRKVFKKFGLRLSAMRSKDPNMPDNQQDHVYLQWSCVREDAPQVQDPLCKPKTFRVNEIYNIKPDELTYKAVYKFTLTVGVWPNDLYKKCNTCDNVKPTQANLRVEVGAEGEKTPNIVTTCVQNCGPEMVPNQKIFLKANIEYESLNQYKFKWSYLEKGKEKEMELDGVPNLPSSMLFVKEGTFKEGTEYTVLARVESKDWYSKYTFTTDKMIFEEKCEVQPISGVKGSTDFDIECTLPENGVFTYEFYDKTADETKEGVIFNGRMLGTSNSGELHNVRLTRGTVCIYIINNNGLHQNRTIQVKLADQNVTNELLEEMNTNLSKTIKRGDYLKTLDFISSIPDVVPSEFEKNTIFENLLHYVSDVPVNTLADAKLCASTVSNVLLTLNKPTQLQLGPHLMARTLVLIRSMSEVVSNRVQYREQSQYLSPNEVTLVAEALINCLQATLLCRNENITGVAEDDLELKDLYKLRDGAAATENIIDQVKDIMSFLQAPGQPPTKLATKGDGFVVWVIKNDVEFNLQKLLELEQDITVTLPDRLQSKLESKTRSQEELALQVMNIKDNIFWWRASDVKSKLMSVSLARQARDGNVIKVKRVSPSLGISFTMPNDLKSNVILGIVKQPDPNLDATTLDLSVKVHRLDPIPGSFVSINFIFPFNNNNNSLQVLLLRNFRPDYDMMVTSPKTILITLNNSAYPYTHYHYNDPTFLFLGILPGPEVPINETVSYHLEVNTTLCRFWAGGRWSSEGCQMDKDAKGKHVICQCSHLSIFAAAFPVPPQEIDPFADAKLFLTVLDNPVVVGFVSSILLLYLLVCIFLWHKDRSDKYKKTVIVLKDNYPNDKHPYLVAVFTGSRFNAGTTAHVGLKIFGKSSDSRTHILSCKYRKLLRKNTDDWFLIFCPKPLDEIVSIHIWHDNSGSSPDWFCEKIFLYDLGSNTETLFIVEQWLAIRVNEYPEANLVPAAPHDVQNVKRVFLENFVMGLVEGHILLSIMLRHPRSHVSRLERISIFIAFLMISMLCSIMFYKPDSDDTAGVDDFQYSFGSRELFVSIECLLISLILGSIVLFAFGKAYKQKHSRRKSTLKLNETYQLAQTSSGSKLNPRNTFQTSKKKSFFRHFVESVTKVIKAHPYEPVHMPGSDAVVQVRKMWLVAAWTICLLVIFVCSYLVMLYGLKMGIVNSKKWLTTVLMSLGEEIFVSGPMRILLFALIFSLAFQKMFVANTHFVYLKDIKPITIPLDYEDFVSKITAKRNHPMYSPLRLADRQMILRKRNKRKKWWTFIDFCISIGFAVIVSTVIFVLWSSHYYTSSHVKSLVTSYQVTFVTSPKFFEVRNYTEMGLYLENTLKLSLFRLRWNNGIDIDTDNTLVVKYWASDGLNKMIGLPSIRQLRVVVEFCQTIYPTLKKCLPRWSYSSEDTDVYGPEWSVASWSDSARTNSPWNYTTRDSIPAMLIIFNRLYGGSGRLYGTSGYLATLGPSRDDAERVLTELNRNNWQDPRTRVLFVELTLYNPNEDLFSQTTLIAEYLVSGTVLLKAQVDTLSSSHSLGFWSPVFVVYIVWYLFRSGYVINQLGLLEYLSAGVNNVCRLVVVAVGFITIAIYVTHLQYSAKYLKEFQDSGSDTYFDFDAYSYYFTQTKIVLSILIAVAFLRTILFIRCGRTLISHYYTFLISFRWIIWLTATLVLLVMIFQQLTYLLNAFSMFRVKDLVINKKSLSQLSNLNNLSTAVQLFIIIKTFLLFLISSLYIILFMYFSKLGRIYKLRKTDKFNYFTFVGQQLCYKGIDKTRRDV